MNEVQLVVANDVKEQKVIVIWSIPIPNVEKMVVDRIMKGNIHVFVFVLTINQKAIYTLPKDEPSIAVDKITVP